MTEEAVSKKKVVKSEIEFIEFDGLNYFSRPFSVFGKSAQKNIGTKEKPNWIHDPTQPPNAWVKLWGNTSVCSKLLEVVRCAYFIVKNVDGNKQLQGELKKAEEYQKKYEKNNDVTLPF